MRSILKVLKVAHANLLEWFEMPCIGIYGELFEITWFSGIWKHKQKYRLVQVEASKRWEATIQESNNRHNHACDKIKLTEA